AGASRRRGGGLHGSPRGRALVRANRRWPSTPLSIGGHAQRELVVARRASNPLGEVQGAASTMSSRGHSRGGVVRRFGAHRQRPLWRVNGGGCGMSKTYIVEPGDYAASIAKAHDFFNVDDLWNHPDNAALAQQRDPNLLMPGDEIVIPDLEPVAFQAASGQSHKFIVPRTKLELRLQVASAYFGALKDWNYTVVA